MCSTSDHARPVNPTVRRTLGRAPGPTPGGSEAGRGRVGGGSGAHVVGAMLRVDAGPDTARVDELSAALEGRRSMWGIERRLCARAGALVAGLSTRITVAPDPEEADADAMAAVEAAEFVLMQRMLLALRGSFETAARPYDHRCFGAWSDVTSLDI